MADTRFVLLPSSPTPSPERLRIQGRTALDTEAVYDLWVDGADRLWCATATSIWLVEIEKDRITERFLPSNSPLPEVGGRALAMTQEGELFIGTQAGLLSYRSRSSTPQANYAQLRIFPNPVPSDFTGEVAIADLPAGANVHITTLSGQLIRSLQVRGGTATWNMRNPHGQAVPAGIYIVHSIETSGKSTYAGKIAILR